MKRVFCPSPAPSTSDRTDQSGCNAHLKPRSGIKQHEPKRLCLGGVDDFEDVNVHRAVNHLEFVHQSDVHTPWKRIFQQFGRLCRTAGMKQARWSEWLCRKAPSVFKHAGCNRRSPSESSPPCCPGLPGSSRSGERPDGNPRLLSISILPQHLAQIGVRGPGYVVDLIPSVPFQMPRDGFARFDDVGNVRLAIFVQRRRRTDDNRLHFLRARKIRQKAVKRPLCTASRIVATVMCSMMSARIDGGDLRGVNVQPMTSTLFRANCRHSGRPT